MAQPPVRETALVLFVLDPLPILDIASNIAN